MQMHLHNTNSLYTKVLQVEHPFEPQSAITGDGRGQYSVCDGHPQIHPVILEMLKLDIVHHVACDTEYFLITVNNPRRWNEIEGQLHHIVAKHLE